MIISDEEYLEKVRERLCCNMTELDIKENGCFLFDNNIVIDKRDYFLQCKKDGLSPYKSLVFLEF